MPESQKNKCSELPILGHPTYSWPWVKTSSVRSSPTTLNVWLCALLMVRAYLSLMGNWSSLNSNGVSLGISGVCDMKTSSPLALTVMMVSRTILTMSFFTTSLVSLVKNVGQEVAGAWLVHQPWAPDYVVAVLRKSGCWETPLGSGPPFKQQIKVYLFQLINFNIIVTWSGSGVVSTDLNLVSWPGSCSKSLLLMEPTAAFFGAT